MTQTYQYKERVTCKNCGNDFTGFTSEATGDYLPIAYEDKPFFVPVTQENPQPCPSCAGKLNWDNCRTLVI